MTTRNENTAMTRARVTHKEDMNSYYPKISINADDTVNVFWVAEDVPEGEPIYESPTEGFSHMMVKSGQKTYVFSVVEEALILWGSNTVTFAANKTYGG